MKKLLLLIMLIAFPSQAIELKETTLPIICGPVKEVVEGIQKRFQEDNVFVAMDINQANHDVYHTLFMNNVTGTWTFLAINKQMATACIISSGINANIMGFTGVSR